MPAAKQRRLWRKKYEVPGYIAESLRMLRPPEDIPVSEWAERYRLLDSKSSAMPGPWKNRKTPYLKDIMDELSNYETREIIFCKPTQCGGTEALLNMLGYGIAQDPAPMMLVYPTDDLARSVSKNRLQPMIDNCPALKRLYHETESELLEMQFDGMYLNLVGSNSPADLASKAVKYLFLDEVDKFPGASKKESDPISLARERTKTFATAKIYMTSTPTIKTGHIWKALEDADVEKHFFVPCPHCGEYIELKFKQIHWPEKADDLTISERADQAAYVCQECGCVITDAYKDGMLQAGEWRIVRESASIHKTVGYWLNTLYSPFVRFSDIALAFMRAKNDPEALQNFVNSWLAEPWEDEHLNVSAESVLAQQTGTPAMVVPDWAKLITAGVDVQETSFYWSVRAWGDYMTSQNIAHGQALSWDDIALVMNTPFQNARGDQFLVALCLVDSGYQADSTYAFCVDNQDWAMAAKGASNPMASHFKISKIDKVDSRAYGLPLVIVDGEKYKDMIAARVKKAPGSTGAWMVYQGCDEDYANQVTAEHKVNVKTGGRIVQRWKTRRSHIDNHYLDCEVYAMAAADIRGVRYLHLEAERPPEPTPKREPSTPEENWIGTHDNWI